MGTPIHRGHHCPKGQNWSLTDNYSAVLRRGTELRFRGKQSSIETGQLNTVWHVLLKADVNRSQVSLRAKLSCRRRQIGEWGGRGLGQKDHGGFSKSLHYSSLEPWGTTEGSEAQWQNQADTFTTIWGTMYKEEEGETEGKLSTQYILRRQLQSSARPEANEG